MRGGGGIGNPRGGRGVAAAPTFYQAGAPARLERLPKGRAFMQLADSAFNYNLHGRQGFETLAQVIDAAECYEFAYGDLEEAVKLYDRLATTA